MLKSKNKTVYFLSYLLQGIFGAFWSVFLPVYLRNQFSLSASAIIGLPLLTSLPVLLKPVFSIISDKRPIKGFYRKYYIILGTIIFSVSSLSAGMIPPIDMLFLFTVLIFFAYLGSSLFDACIDSLMVDQLNDSHSRIVTAAIFMTFNSLGTMITGFVFGTVEIITDLSGFFALFLLCALMGLILMVFSFKIEEFSNSKTTQTNEEIETEKNDKIQSKYAKRYLVFGCIFALFLNGDLLSDWVFEPYISNKFGIDAFEAFSFWIFVFSTLSIVGYFVAIKFSNKSDKFALKQQNPLIVCLLVFAVNYTLIPFSSFNAIIIEVALNFIASGIATILFINIFMSIAQTLKKETKGAIYQLLLAIFALSKGIFGSIGLVLESSISPEFALIMSGVPMLIAIIALLLMNFNLKKFQKI